MTMHPASEKYKLNQIEDTEIIWNTWFSTIEDSGLVIYQFEYLRSWGSYGTLINKRGVKKKSIIWILVWVWERTHFHILVQVLRFLSQDFHRYGGAEIQVAALEQFHDSNFGVTWSSLLERTLWILLMNKTLRWDGESVGG